MMIDTFYFVGFGSIARSLIEIWQLEDLYHNIKMVAIEPLDIPEWCFEKHKMKHVKEAITKRNAKRLLKKINENTLVIDLSVDVDCLLITGICKNKGSLYVCTSVENWANYEKDKNIKSTSYNRIKKDTLYYRQMLLDEQNRSTDQTILSNIGFNPGMISVMALCAIDMIYAGYKEFLDDNDMEDEPSEPDERDETFYAKFCKDSGLVSIQVVELDTQITDIKPKKDTMFNTWSSEGWTSECTDNVMMGYNKDDPDFKKNKYEGHKLIFPNEGKKNVIFLPVRGMDITKETKTLDLEGEPVKYRGFLIPHAEANTLSSYLEYDGHRPSVYYVYSPSKICIESTNYLRENNYKPLANWHVLELSEIKSGYDSIGCLFTFDSGEQYILCSIVDTEYVKSLGFKHCQSTGLQVAGSLHASIKYILRGHEDEGVINPENLPHQWIFREAEKYLGKIYFKSI